VYFAFDAEKLLKAPVAPVEYQSPPATIPSARDISVAVPYGRAAGDVADFIIEKYPDVAKAVISDVYDKPKERARSITFALEFSGARSAESMNALILDIMAGAAEFASR
jgi:phenylalanyl-tRNA synthetase beta subunit